MDEKKSPKKIETKKKDTVINKCFDKTALYRSELVHRLLFLFQELRIGDLIIRS